MKNNHYTASGKALTALVLEIFRLNNRLLTAGDRLVAEVGLTSARWKVLGTIIAAHQPQPVAWLARDMGGNRQNVQRIVNDLVDEKLLELHPNPHHKRAPLVVLTSLGKQRFEQAMALQAPWISELADSLTTAEIATTQKVVTTLCQRLEIDK